MPTTATTPTKRRASGADLRETELAAWRGFLLVHSAVTKELDAELALEHGLPLSSYEVLLHLANEPGGRKRMSGLAESVLLSRSGLTRLVDRLEREGLVKREGCKSDARGLNAVITTRGRELFTRARRTHLKGVRERFLAHLSDDEQRVLGELWERFEPDAPGPTC